MSSSIAATIVGVLLAAVLAGIGFLIKSLINSITSLNVTVATDVKDIKDEVNGLANRVGIIEVSMKSFDITTQHVASQGTALAVLASEVEQHQNWHKEQIIAQRERDRRDRT